MASSPEITTANTKIADFDSLKYREVIEFLGEIAVQDAGEDEAQARIFSEINRLFQIEWSALYLRDDLTDQWFIKKVCSTESGWSSHVVHADELGK